MKVNFRRIILEDCFAYSYVEFEFGSGIHSIQGINGSSKTSIYLALAQGLFNRNPKNTKVDAVSNLITGNPYQITIEFEKEGNLYTVINSRKTGTITVSCNGKNISKKTIPANLELIKEIIGDTYENFVSTTYQASDSTLDLLEETGDSARKNFINKVLRFDELDSMLADCKAKLKSVKASHKEKQASIITLKSGILPYREPGALIDIETLQNEVSTIAENKERAEELVECYRIEEQFAKSQWEKYDSYIKTYNKVLEIKTAMKAINLPKQTLQEVELEHAEYTKKLTETKLRARQIGDKLATLTEPEVVCSRCGHELSSEAALSLYNVELDHLSVLASDYTQRIKEYEGKLWLLDEYKIIWKCYNGYAKELSQLKIPTVTGEADAETHPKAVVKLNEAVRSYKKLEADYISKMTELTQAEGKNELVRMVEKFNREAEENNAKIRSKIVATQTEVEELEKRQDLLDNWIRILGPNGYRVHSMTRFLEVLNQTMDKYATIISGGRIKCSFFVTEEGKIDFYVVDPDKKVPFANWSKGEQARVKLACLFSVIDLLEIKGSASYNVLVLDEIFSALDEEGKEGLFEVLSYLRANGKCIYTISHTPLVNPVVFDSAIQVVKEAGLARII